MEMLIPILQQPTKWHSHPYATLGEIITEKAVF